MTIPAEIVELWQQHSSSAFPKGYARTEVKGFDLPLLDAEITGSVRMYIHSDGVLDSRQVKILRDRLIDLNTAVFLLDSENLVYFDRLRQLANLVLQEVDR